MPQDLNELDLAVRREIYDAPMNGKPIPTREQLARNVKCDTRTIGDALRNLSNAHMIVLQPESGEVLMANPFSAVPTPFLVTIGDRHWFGNCIWDSMGIAAMLHESVVLQTSCGCCGYAMTLRIPEDCIASDERVAHFAIPAAHWWDDIVFN